jgi:hypothetical protein
MIQRIRSAVRRLTPGGWTSRQWAAVVLVVSVTTAASITAAYGSRELAAILAGLVVIALVLAVVRLLRRLERHEKAMADRSRAVMERLELAQRQMLAAVENERLAAHDRHVELLGAVRGFQEALARSIAPCTDAPAKAEARHG